MVTLIVCMMMVGCDYTIPLTTVPGPEIEKGLTGLWERVKDKNPVERLLILPLDAHNYLVSFPAHKSDGLFAKATPCLCAGKTLVQVQWIGTAGGKLPDDNRVYQVVSYGMAGDQLSIRLLNTAVIGKETQSTAELRRAIEKNIGRADLFNEPLVFTRSRQ